MTFFFPSGTEDLTPKCPRSSFRLSIQVSSVYCSIIDLSFYYTPPPPPPPLPRIEYALFNSGMEVQCVSVSEHVWVGGGGLRGGGGELPGGIHASQGTFFSQNFTLFHMK